MTNKNRLKSLDPFVLLFSVTLCLSAGLSFVMQPLIGKMLLPLVGGAPSGWLVTMVFFQVTLLIGYAIAHILSRESPLTHTGVVCFLLLVGFSMMPLRIAGGILETAQLPEALRVFLSLAFGLTLPCVAIFSLSPSLQRLFDAANGREKRDPYFLFAASNLGSLGGLLAYPFVIERVSGIAAQISAWQIGYEALIALCIGCLVYARRKIAPHKKAKAKTKVKKLSWRQRGWYVLLAFIPSSLMLGVTAHVTADAGSVPLFWVLPLALYLLTFILAFAHKQYFKRETIALLQSASIALLIFFFIKKPGVIDAGPEQTLFPLVAFFFTALLCHTTLAAARPPAQRLTEFYLWLAIGGALGGIFNTFIAPFIFPLPIELMVVALLSLLVHPRHAEMETRHMQKYFNTATLVAIGATITSILVSSNPQIFRVLGIILLPPLGLISLRPRWLATLGFVLCVMAFVLVGQTGLQTVERNFFGVLRVVDTTEDGTTLRALYHGTTIHGVEQTAPEVDVKPRGYYDASGPLGDVSALLHPNDVGIVGLGAGSLLCPKTPGRHFTAYEIDPAVVGIAAQWFDFMDKCGVPDIRLGDGRKQLAAAENDQYDLLYIDAFTSDTIPVHLLTQEAFETYFERLKPHGVLAVHISNRFYDLRGPISGIADALGLAALYKRYDPAPGDKRVYPSAWVLLALDESTLAPFRKRDWIELPQSTARVWTDDYSDTISALAILHTYSQGN